MRTKEELDRLRERSIALRREGKSRTEIQAILGLAGRSTLNEFLRGVPPPDWTRRPNAKDDLRDKARQLRAKGLNYNQITARLGVSKSSVSLWVRDLPTPPGLSYEENRRRSAEGARQYWEKERRVRQAHQADERIAAAAEIGELTPREILIAGAVAYWCEGAKSKPHRQQYCVAFMNSDPGLIRLFLRFLDAAGIPRSDLVFTVCIHESGDVAAAQQFWLKVTQASSEQFNKPSLKRHNPTTTRKNVGEDYHGCLRVGVHQSSVLVRKIEGWAQAIVANPTGDEGQVSNRPS
jgi:transcriptional regulator with XRE-family HTH domain